MLITFRGMWLFSRQGRDWHVSHLWLIVSNSFVKPSYTTTYSKHYQEYFILQTWPQNLNLSVGNSWSKGKWYITDWPSMEFSSFIYNGVYYCKLLLHTSYQILSRRKSALRLMELDWCLPDEDTALLVTQGWNTSFSVVLRLWELEQAGWWITSYLNMRIKCISTPVHTQATNSAASTHL